MPAAIQLAAIDDSRRRENGHGYGGLAKNTSPGASI